MIDSKNSLAVAAGLAVVVALGVAGCDGKKDGPEKVKIGFLVKQAEEPWFQNEWKFAQQCADQYGFELIKIDVADGERVLTAIGTLGARGAKGFVICTPDVKLGPAIVRAAKNNDLKVYAVDDRFLGEDGKPMADVPYMGIDARKIGQTVGKALWDEMQKRGWKIEETAACGITYPDLPTSVARTEGAKHLRRLRPKQHDHVNRRDGGIVSRPAVVGHHEFRPAVERKQFIQRGTARKIDAAW